MLASSRRPQAGVRISYKPMVSAHISPKRRPPATITEFVLGIAVMSAFVTVINRAFWRPLYYYAERKFRLG